MYAFLFLVISAIIFYLLAQINLLLGLLFFILALVAFPASVLHRREARSAPDVGSDAESRVQGLRRLLSIIGLDTTGIALGVLLIILFALVARKMAYH